MQPWHITLGMQHCLLRMKEDLERMNDDVKGEEYKKEEGGSSEKIVNM